MNRITIKVKKYYIENIVDQYLKEYNGKGGWDDSTGTYRLNELDCFIQSWNGKLISTWVSGVFTAEALKFFMTKCEKWWFEYEG